MSPPPIHQAAATGYATGADTYAKGRPDYPAALHDWLAGTVGIAPGKFTRLLAATGASVIAVEPVPEMLARLQADLPQVHGVQGTATSIPLPDASVDAVVCAQAFHWFATADALTEIARVLKPGGHLALVWNLRDASVPWVARLDAIVDAHEGDVPRFYKGSWRAAFPHPALSESQASEFVNGHTGPAEDVIVKRALSTSFISALPAEAKAQVEAQLRELIATTPELQGQAAVSVPYRTFAFCCSKR